MGSEDKNGWLKPAAGIVAAGIGGLGATVLVLVLFYRAGGLPAVASPVVLDGASLQLANGQGGPTGAGLEVRQSDSHGLISIQGSARMVRASIYRHLSWQVEGLKPGRELRLIWTTLAEPRTARQLVLPPAGAKGGTLDLGLQAHWEGRIAVIGLVLRDTHEQPLFVRRLELGPPVLGVMELARLAFEEWTVFEDWSQRSINYTAGAPLDALFPPVLMVALWLGFSAALYAVVFHQSRSALKSMPYMALFLVGWFVLDLRWQWDLHRRLAQTEARFAGKSENERLSAGSDSDLYRFLLQVRQRLPEQPARLFIVSADPGGFEAGRARYHLLPHNGFMGFSKPPKANVAHPGDYILLLSPLSGIRYDRDRQQLEWANQRLPAELLHFASLGGLFRVRGG